MFQLEAKQRREHSCKKKQKKNREGNDEMEGEENQWEGSQERERPVTLGERALFTPPPSNYRVHTAASITRSSARLLFTAARQRPRRRQLRQLVKEEIHHRTQVNPPEDPPLPNPPPPPPPRSLISSAEQTPPGRVNTQDDSSCLPALLFCGQSSDAESLCYCWASNSNFFLFCSSDERRLTTAPDSDL